MNNQLHPIRSSHWIVQGVFVIASLALLLVLILVLRTTFDPQARSQAEVELYRQNMQAERLQWADDIAGIAWRLLPVGLVAAAGIVGLLALYKRFATQEMLRAQFVVKALEAQHQPGQLPATLHYNPRISGNETARLALPPALYSQPSLTLSGHPCCSLISTLVGALLDATYNIRPAGS